MKLALAVIIQVPNSMLEILPWFVITVLLLLTLVHLIPMVMLLHINLHRPMMEAIWAHRLLSTHHHHPMQPFLTEMVTVHNLHWALPLQSIQSRGLFQAWLPQVVTM